MSGNPRLTDEQIKALMLSANTVGCGLIRFAVALGHEIRFPWMATELIDIAVSGGISRIKAHGVMDGWDISDGQLPLQATYIPGLTSEQDYWDGVAIGKAVYNETIERDYR